jgi:hypothetical protein
LGGKARHSRRPTLHKFVCAQELLAQHDVLLNLLEASRSPRHGAPCRRVKTTVRQGTSSPPSRVVPPRALTTKRPCRMSTAQGLLRSFSFPQRATPSSPSLASISSRNGKSGQKCLFDWSNRPSPAETTNAGGQKLQTNMGDVRCTLFSFLTHASRLS